MGNSLRSDEFEGELRLSRGHGICQVHMAVRSPDRRYLFAVSSTLGQPCRHVIDRIDLMTPAVSLVSAGSGTAFVQFANDGSLYIQTGRLTRRLASVTSSLEEGVPLPEGIGLSPALCL